MRWIPNQTWSMVKMLTYFFSNSRLRGLTRGEGEPSDTKLDPITRSAIMSPHWGRCVFYDRMLKFYTFLGNFIVDVVGEVKPPLGNAMSMLTRRPVRQYSDCYMNYMLLG